ncbi:acyl-ACP--UDP-N-acetylglucosamine O-acyltransferase [Legionella brunensis]|uniref:Acyl-[acyl-carrier-protein]--UDP-N-acetylglucosamine O-acyltransferase n=1 Tax=Legionella brunensis TaxID=29422 RepID=A0A0W0SND2_9GAMM|nr:acyl-ACP--UDP-N-acetylglucosamine O-acyltransferase [Legionella brunensis]KTC84906.1 UDP-N-acetylglucosamine acyltransferase [Legionella brunensis]
MSQFSFTQIQDNVVSMPQNQVHPSALISRHAKIGKNVEIGAFAIIGDHVIIGEETKIGPHTIIESWTTIGKRNQIYAGAIIGNAPQDLKYKGEQSSLLIGDDNIIREYATISRGTMLGGGITCIGNHNLIMSYVHVAHDVLIGNHNVIAHAAGIGGHVVIEDWVTVGGLSGIHQFVKLGRLAMVGAKSMVVKDVTPYALVKGNPAKLYGVNFERLRRNHFTPEERLQIQRAYKILFNSGLNLNEAIEMMEQELSASESIDYLLQFLYKSNRGIYRTST